MRRTHATPRPHDADSFSEGCAHCGSTFEQGEWYPVAEETDRAGQPTLHSFCDEQCKDAWLTSSGPR